MRGFFALLIRHKTPVIWAAIAVVVLGTGSVWVANRISQLSREAAGTTITPAPKHARPIAKQPPTKQSSDDPSLNPAAPTGDKGWCAPTESAPSRWGFCPNGVVTITPETVTLYQRDSDGQLAPVTARELVPKSTLSSQSHSWTITIPSMHELPIPSAVTFWREPVFIDAKHPQGWLGDTIISRLSTDLAMRFYNPFNVPEGVTSARLFLYNYAWKRSTPYAIDWAAHR